MLRRVIVLLVLIAGVASAPPASAEKPPSFALWTVKWKAQNDAAQSKVARTCTQAFGETSRKAGECFVKGMMASLRALQPKWEKQDAAIARGQSKPCRTAIHQYWLASRKAQKASLIYFDSHQRTEPAQIASDFSEEPFNTLRSLTEEAKARAIRICG